MTLPTITITSADRGWLAVCSCGWQFWQVRRPVVDIEATNHRAKCASKEK